MSFSHSKKLVSEGLGTALLLAVVIGSGIMGERLSGGNDAIALLGNTLATGAALIVLISIFGPISGAHFNPAVTLAFFIRKEMGWKLAIGYVVIQMCGAVMGIYIAHEMFAEPLFQVSTKLRDGSSQIFSEFIASFGLFITIFGVARFKKEFIATAVGLYITAAYWFTASTSFANPAVTIARSLSDSFAGIAPSSVLPFILAQFFAAIVATFFCAWLFNSKET